MTDAQVEAACATLKRAIEAAENSNQAGEDFVMAAAAGPALLEALQHAVGVIEAHVPREALGVAGDPQDGMWPLLDEYLHHMKAAIRKAKGEA